MAMMWFGCAAALGIGVLLGMLGGGGSIVTIPVLVYLLDFDEKGAVAASLVVVGVTSAIGALLRARKSHIDWNVAMWFAITGAVGAYAGTWLSQFLSGKTQVLMLAGVMVVAAALMWSPLQAANLRTTPTTKRAATILMGTAVGMLTGLVGAGGGFLLVPALTLLSGLPLQTAMGTSLAVIACNAGVSVVGTMMRAGVAPFADARVVMVTVLTVAGLFVGTRISARIPAQQLRRGFAVFVWCVAAFLVVMQQR
jgi:uncharacterized protein